MITVGALLEFILKHREDKVFKGFTEEEIQQVIELGTTKPRDKAFIALLHETGCRAGEFLIA